MQVKLITRDKSKKRKGLVIFYYSFYYEDATEPAVIAKFVKAHQTTRYKFVEFPKDKFLVCEEDYIKRITEELDRQKTRRKTK